MLLICCALAIGGDIKNTLTTTWGDMYLLLLNWPESNGERASFINRKHLFALVDA